MFFFYLFASFACRGEDDENLKKNMECGFTNARNALKSELVFEEDEKKN